MENETGVGRDRFRTHWMAPLLCRYDPIEPLIILLCDTGNETPSYFYNPTWKKKLVSVGIDPDRTVDFLPTTFPLCYSIC